MHAIIEGHADQRAQIKEEERVITKNAGKLIIFYYDYLTEPMKSKPQRGEKWENIKGKYLGEGRINLFTIGEPECSLSSLLILSSEGRSAHACYHRRPCRPKPEKLQRGD